MNTQPVFELGAALGTSRTTQNANAVKLLSPVVQEAAGVPEGVGDDESVGDGVIVGVVNPSTITFPTTPPESASAGAIANARVAFEPLRNEVTTVSRELSRTADAENVSELSSNKDISDSHASEPDRCTNEAPTTDDALNALRRTMMGAAASA
jgi:hypothetical protein